LRRLTTQELLIILGFLIAAILIGTALHAPPPWRDVLISVASSFIFASTSGILITIQDALSQRDLVRFFGRELVKKSTHLAYPDFVVHDEVLDILSSRNKQFIFQKPKTSPFKKSREHRVDIECAAATNDIQALLYVSSLFESTHGCQNLIYNDAYMVKHCAHSFISFGLSSNDCTHLYLQQSGTRALFNIVPDEHGSEFLRFTDGTKCMRSDEQEFGVIVRYTPDPEEPQRRWFLVAGLGPSGTTGAAWFLSQNWRRLLKKAGSTKDFCAIVTTQTSSDKAARLLKIICAED